MRITHVVVTDAFAGTERYVCEVASRQAARGHDVRVIGGSERRMPDSAAPAQWQPAGTLGAAVRRLAAGGRRDVVHTHLTTAELAAVVTSPAHQALLVSTRHIAAPRGSSALGSLAVPLIERRIDVEVAISRFVAKAINRPPGIVLPNGVTTCETPYDVRRRAVLLLQRLEPEKDTETALRAWDRSGLAASGWTLVVAGEGSCRPALERQAGTMSGVRFLGHVDDVSVLLRDAAVLLAPAPGEPLGLSVLEAMACGVPVVAAAGGGHLETLPEQWPWVFAPGDAAAAGDLLRRMADDPDARADEGARLRAHQRRHFEVERHTDAVLALYTSSAATRRGPRANT